MEPNTYEYSTRDFKRYVNDLLLYKNFTDITDRSNEFRALLKMFLKAHIDRYGESFESEILKHVKDISFKTNPLLKENANGADTLENDNFPGNSDEPLGGIGD